MSASKNGMQPMQMQTSASTSGNNGISAKPIIIVLSAVVLGLMALVVGGGVAVYKVIQTHHMNANTLMQLKSVEEMVNTLKVEQKSLMSALIDKEKELEDADFVGDSAEAEKKEEEMEKILDEVIEVEDEIEEEEQVEEEIEDELHANDKGADKDGKEAPKKQSPEDKKTAQEKKAALNDKVAEKQAAIKKKEDARQKAFPEILKDVKSDGAKSSKTKQKGKGKGRKKSDSRLLRGSE